MRKDGSRFWANVVITALHDESGALRGFSKITRDLTERRRQRESLRQSEERFRVLVEGVGDYAMFMLDPDGQVTSWNAGAERIQGYKAQEILGGHISLLYPQEAIDKKWPGRSSPSPATRALRGRGGAGAQGRHDFLGERHRDAATTIRKGSSPATRT